MRPPRTFASYALPFLALLLCSAPAAAQGTLKGPAAVCGWLTPAQLQKALGSQFAAPERHDWPPAYAGQPWGTSCTFNAGSSSDVVLIGYIDPSAAEAKATFERLSTFFPPESKVTGVGDEAYIDKNGAIHVLKGKYRYFIRIDGGGAQGKAQVQNLAGLVAGVL